MNRRITTRALHGQTGTPAWRSWNAMIQRCLNPSHTSYSFYGGRGITVCQRWLDFPSFLADMGERAPGMTLDRFPDQSGNYEPGNVRWATTKQQGQNTRRFHVTDELRTQACAMKAAGCTMSEIGEALGIDKSYVSRITRDTKAPRKCKNGHLLAEGGVYEFTRANGKKVRVCRICRSANQKRNDKQLAAKLPGGVEHLHEIENAAKAA